MVVVDTSYGKWHHLSGTIAEVMDVLGAKCLDPINLRYYSDNGTNATAVVWIGIL